MHACRSNLSYGRYWEGRTQLQQMSSKLTDCVVMALKWDREAFPKENPTAAQLKDHQWFRDTMIHLVSLMHAVALSTLRTDFNMENIVVRVYRAPVAHTWADFRRLCVVSPSVWRCAVVLAYTRAWCSLRHPLEQREVPSHSCDQGQMLRFSFSVVGCWWPTAVRCRHMTP